MSDLRRGGTPNRGNSWSTPDQLTDMYCTQKLSTYQIAEKLGVTPPSVRYWLKKWKFDIRGKSESQLGEHNPIWVGGRSNWAPQKLQKYALDYKSSKGCEICGYDKCIAALEFHHKDPQNKSFFITRGLSLIGLSKDKNFDQALGVLQAEIAKCTVMCGNCHNEIHHKEILHRGVLRILDGLKKSGCKLCGYTRCLSALEFHHRDSGDKLFTIGRAKNHSKPLQEILKEVEKCDILCCNCHRELEYIEKLKKLGL